MSTLAAGMTAAGLSPASRRETADRAISACGWFAGCRIACWASPATPITPRTTATTSVPSLVLLITRSYNGARAQPFQALHARLRAGTQLGQHSSHDRFEHSSRADERVERAHRLDAGDHNLARKRRSRREPRIREEDDVHALAGDQPRALDGVGLITPVIEHHEHVDLAHVDELLSGRGPLRIDEGDAGPQKMQLPR